MSKCQIGMVQTICRRLDKTTPPDFIITDESHRSPSMQYRKIYDYFPSAKRLGMTATAERTGTGGLEKTHDVIIEGVSAKWLIENKFLSPFRYYAPSVTDLSKVKKKRGDFDQDEVSSLLDKPKIYGDVISHYRDLADGKKAICFCPTIEYSKKIAEAFRNEGINAIHFDGETPPKERKQIIQDFRDSKIQVLMNVNLISEGLSIDNVECTILLRPTQSTILFVQSSMRSLRYMEGKEAVIIDHVGNCFRFGLPDEDRKFSLKETVKRESDRATNSVRTCERCYFTFRSTQTVCPECGHINQRSREELKQIEQAKLQEITEAKRAKAIERLDGKKMDECRTLQDFQAWAKLNGKSSGWAYIMWKKKVGK